MPSLSRDDVRPHRSAATWRLWVATVLRLVLAGVLATAGALKLPEPASSVRAVRAYQLLPEAVVPTVGYVLPLLELAVALLLLGGLATRLAATAAALLMVAFIIGIASAAARGLSIDCGCFGGGGQVAAGATRYTPEIVRDVALLLAAGFLVLWPASRFSLDHTPTRNPNTNPNHGRAFAADHTAEELHDDVR